ncbi:16S rRNA (guanine(966)-N(2))-methyltransferase RsmD [Noviherbaspirillum galbum]|uniref:16S rRNA (Guanine(966)-N(2))-methyltransferase RsmD n=1 Tax=Noviherbaspirillum galbum TaxID=2709383 RepID=A0A6B3SYB4_9BURK|nr:16S rRNA (guanine(966)-N(2))-methyltransferase RsmD [Noviherbaspirillum galbum]NEX64326.1 16S rRNA (guanine(966)-N(2))-methyltransferase RsmD [Noviherbaspirillum galbum]
MSLARTRKAAHPEKGIAKAKGRPAGKADAQHAPHQVRIIGGQWKRTPLAVLDAEGLRPTPDRVRETVFNWLNHLLGNDWPAITCLDLFAGTGALGFEAASRGAAGVTLVESHAGATRQLEATRLKLGAEQVKVRRGDALAVASQLAAAGERFDLIFLDPPFHHDWMVKTLPLCRQLLTKGGLVYAEAERPLDEGAGEAPEWMAGWEAVRADKAGMSCFHLLRCKETPQNQA